MKGTRLIQHRLIGVLGPVLQGLLICPRLLSGSIGILVLGLPLLPRPVILLPLTIAGIWLVFNSSYLMIPVIRPIMVPLVPEILVFLG